MGVLLHCKKRVQFNNTHYCELALKLASEKLKKVAHAQLDERKELPD